MNTASLTAPSSVGLSATEPGEIHAAILTGLPYKALVRFEKHTHFPGATIARAVGIPARTLIRRKQAKRLTPGESDRLYRLAVVFAKAAELFAGDIKAAREWLTKPARGLGHKVPLEFAQTAAGERMVLDLIGRLQHGVFT